MELILCTLSPCTQYLKSKFLPHRRYTSITKADRLMLLRDSHSKLTAAFIIRITRNA
jgi:hypothetical protein